MIPKITTATVRAGLQAACPPAEKLDCGIYCRFSPTAVPKPTDGAPSFAGLTEHGTLIIIRFSPEEKPQVRYMSLLALKKVRILGAFQRYLIRLTFFSSRVQQEYTLAVSAHPLGVTLPYQPENMKTFFTRLRALQA